jgi:hypothetical protein
MGIPASDMEEGVDLDRVHLNQIVLDNWLSVTIVIASCNMRTLGPSVFEIFLPPIA